MKLPTKREKSIEYYPKNNPKNKSTIFSIIPTKEKEKERKKKLNRLGSAIFSKKRKIGLELI